jgi:hypothetical protein
MRGDGMHEGERLVNELDVVRDLLVEGEAGASENRMITGRMEVVEGARRMFSEISATSMPEAKRALCHATSGRGGCVG